MRISADVVAFGVVANWLYSQKVVTSGVDELILSTLAQAWILADRFLIPKLQNQIMLHIYEICFDIYAWKDKDYKNFETFAKIAWTYGDGNNKLFEVIVGHPSLFASLTVGESKCDGKASIVPRFPQYL